MHEFQSVTHAMHSSDNCSSLYEAVSDLLLLLLTRTDTMEWETLMLSQYYLHRRPSTEPRNLSENVSQASK